MTKRTILLSFCVLLFTVAVIPSWALADFYVIPINRSPLSGATQSLCEYPYWMTAEHTHSNQGIIEVRYDPRFYDPRHYPPSQLPPGGIRIEYWLGTFTSAAARDALANKISKFVLFNNDTGDYYEVTRVSTYDYLGDPSGDFGIWLGHQSAVIGTWDFVIVADGKKYDGTFTLTQAMFDRTPPIPVEPTVTSSGGKFTITAPITNGEQYRFRIFDENQNVIDQSNMTIDSQSGMASVETQDLQYAGYTARIETRIYTDEWIALMNWGDFQSCNANGGVPGAGTARSSIYFKLQEVPVPQ